MNYLIGDLQGCCSALENLLSHLDFSPSRDHLYFLGDLINRGPASLQTLRRLQGMGHSATCLLGNHDLHFLAVAHGTRSLNRNDTLNELLDAPDRAHLVDWLRGQRLAVFEHGWLMVHAGVVPQWHLGDVLALASQVEQRLRGSDLAEFLQVMYGNDPNRWDASLAGDARLRFVVNVLTRIRFCTLDGALDMSTKDGQADVPPGLCRWFEAPQRQTSEVPIAFGHWSTLGLMAQPHLLSLDTGCVWGGKLTAARLSEGSAEIFQVECEQAQRPG
jgi:bis(5'-nucleosyl)-tetraphosphatase (symmetrical)